MIVKLLTEHGLEFLSLKGGCTGSYEFTTHVEIPHCWKSHVRAQLFKPTGREGLSRQVLYSTAVCEANLLLTEVYRYK